MHPHDDKKNFPHVLGNSGGLGAKSYMTRGSFETSFDSKQPKLEPKLVSALSETKPLFRLFRLVSVFWLNRNKQKINRNSLKESIYWCFFIKCERKPRENSCFGTKWTMRHPKKYDVPRPSQLSRSLLQYYWYVEKTLRKLQFGKKSSKVYHS